MVLNLAPPPGLDVHLRLPLDPHLVGGQHVASPRQDLRSVHGRQLNTFPLETKLCSCPYQVSIMVGSYIFRAASTILAPQRCLLVSASLFLISTIIASQVGGLCFSGFLLVIILLPSLCTCDHLVAFQLAMSTTFPSKLGSLLAFVLIEIALGIYFPSIGTLRRYCSYAKTK